MSRAQTRLRERAPAPGGSRAMGFARAIAPVLAAGLIAALLHFWLAPLLPAFFPRILLDIGINVILAVSLTMVNGFTGQFSLGHAAFMAVGAYTAATLVYYGSARLHATEDFAVSNTHAGVFSTMLSEREVELCDGTIARDVQGDAFVPAHDAALEPGRDYALRRFARSAPGEPASPVGQIELEAEQAQVAAGAPLALPGGVPDDAWVGADVRLIQVPALFSKGDGLFLVALVAGGLAAAFCGYLVGLPSLRLKGDYLAIVTLGFGEIVRVLIQSQTTESLYDPAAIAATPWWQLPHYMGGPVGFTGLPSYTSLFWVWIFATLTLAVAYRLKESTFGRAFLSIREDEIAAEAMGIRTTKYKVQAFVIAAFFAGIAGGLYAHTIGIQLNAGELAFMKSFDIIIMVVLGGMGSISGAAIAAVILTILPEALRDPPAVQNPIMLGVLALSVVLVLLFTRRRARSLLLLGLAVGLYALVRQAALEAGIVLSDYRMIFYALALILMMILRPQGLFGVREIWNAWRVQPARRAP